VDNSNVDAFEKILSLTGGVGDLTELLAETSAVPRCDSSV
jgi:hypothetical protein